MARVPCADQAVAGAADRVAVAVAAGDVVARAGVAAAAPVIAAGDIPDLPGLPAKRGCASLRRVPFC